MIYINDRHNVTHAVTITINDQDGDKDTDWACWAVDDGEDTRYVEGFVGSELWDIIALAAKAYEEEEEE